MSPFSPDLRLLWAPTATFREMRGLAANVQAPPKRWPLVLRFLIRLFIAPTIAGTAASVSATNRISWSLFLSGMICWSFIAAVQLLNATLLIRREGRPIGYARALQVFFTAHAAWSLWLIAAAVCLFAAPDSVVGLADFVLLTAVVPLGWTAAMVFSYCREVLRLDRRRAALRTAVHQGLTGLVITVYVAWAIQLWPRLLASTLR